MATPQTTAMEVTEVEDNGANPYAGVWIVSGRYWGHDGPSWVIPFGTEIEAMRAMNAGDGERVFFVPFGVDLADAMKAWPKLVGE
jgi:hypothetical protein